MKARLTFAAAVLAVAGLVLAACSPIQDTRGAAAPEEAAPAEAGAPALEGTNWLLESFASADGQATAALEGVQVTALFADGQVSGSAGCNNYSGGYTVDGSSLTVGPLVSTMMACIGPVMDQETAYLTALQSAASYAIVDGTLQISDAAGQVVLTYGVQVLPTLTGTTWYATGVNNGRQAVVSLVAGSEITAVFAEDGSLAGSAGCNNYFSSFTTDGDQIQIAPAGSTMMMCEEPQGLMEQEAAYLTALTTAATYSIRGDQLELRTADGALAVSYTATPPASAEAPAASAPEVGAPTLEGTNWLLESLAGADGQTTAALADVQVTALFVAGRVGGSGGCNNYGGSYTVDGSSLSVGPLASTMMACVGPVMDQETAYLSALQSAASYAIVDGKLQISDAAGLVVLTYGVQVLPSLTGTTWYATGVNNGRQAVVSLVIGSETTAVFGEDGSLTGSAGCNNYMTSYTTDGDQIQIEPAASTRMMCPEPEGVMEQEAAYLTALTTAATYSISGDRLELRTADGALAVGYSAPPPAGAEAPAAPAAEAPAAPAGTVPLPAELLNATYTVPDIGTITLQDGKYEDTANRVEVTLLPYAAEGELDGTPSTAVILVANTGGSGVFNYLAIMQQENGGWVNVATTLLGDRIDINSLTIENNQVVVEMVTQGPDDPMCCATTIVRRTYELKDGQLEMTSDEVIGKVESGG